MAQPIFQPVTLKGFPTADGHCAFCHARHGRQSRVRDAVVEDVLVDLVGDGNDLMLAAEIGNQVKFLARINLAGRIVRRIDDNGAGAGVESSCKLVRIEAPLVTAQRHIVRSKSRHHHVGHIAVIDRLEDDHFVARIGQSQDRGENRFGGAGGDQNLGLPIDLLTVKTLRMACHRFAQDRHADARRILVQLDLNRFHSRSQNFRRTIEVRRALAEIDCVALSRQIIDLDEYRGAKSGDPPGHS